jgi:hypothetical protein
MHYLPTLPAAAVLLSCLGWTVPAPYAVAAGGSCTPAGEIAANQPPPVSDVQLDAGGTLRGLVLNLEGVPVADLPVLIRQGDRQLALTHTDLMGRFSAGQLRGGTYQVTVGGRSKLLRAWAEGTAPPSAKPLALVVVGSNVVRGHMPAQQFFASDQVIIAGLVAAVIAIPIAVHSSSTPASP